jgi:glutathione S-transferase
MKLYWSPSSPFVRKVMICADEAGVKDRIEMIRAGGGPTRLNPVLLADNPLNKIPTLLTGDGEALYDSRVICEYLNALGPGHLFPTDPARRWTAIRRQAMADGVCDVIILQRDEHLRGEGYRSPAHQVAFAAKALGGLDRAEREAAALAATPFDIGHVAVGCCLSYLDFRAPELAWREGRPALAAWYEGFEQRPSAAANPLVDPGGPKVFPFYSFDKPTNA